MRNVQMVIFLGMLAGFVMTAAVLPLDYHGSGAHDSNTTHTHSPYPLIPLPAHSQMLILNAVMISAGVFQGAQVRVHVY